MRRSLNVLTATGLTLVAALVASRFLLGFVAFDTPEREAVHVSIACSGFLLMGWFILGSFVAVKHWRATSCGFRMTLALSTVLVTLLLYAAF